MTTRALRQCLIPTVRSRFMTHLQSLYTQQQSALGFHKMNIDSNPVNSLKHVIDVLNKIAPPSLAEPWDNVGLLVEPPTPTAVKRVLLTNDLTEDVLEEAVQKEVQLILSYHPPIFAALKSITSKNWKERIIGTLLEKKIALYSPHTAWDSVKGGVNDWLASAFGSTDVVPLHQQYSTFGPSHKVEVEFSDSVTAEKATQEIHSLGLVSHTSMHFPDTLSVSVLCKQGDIPNLAQILDAATNLRVVKLDQKPVLSHGSGRKVRLHHPIELQKAVEIVKQHLNLKDVALAIARDKSLASMISTVALCAGSGASVLKGVSADIYLTGEMQHHDVLDAVHNNTHVILTRHSNSERGFLQHVVESSLRKDLPEIDFLVSKCDRDPLETA